MKKKGILLVVLLLAVGFAAVTTTLFINGTTNIGTNKSDFEVYYSKAEINGVEDNTVITDETHIVFTQEMKKVGETYVLDYDVTNGSRNYDADLTMTCTESNEYLSVTNVFDTDTTLPATETRTGKLTIELIKGYVGETTKEVTIECTINANAIERNTQGTNKVPEKVVLVPVEAKDSTGRDLKATSYEIVGTEKDILLEKLVETGKVASTDEVDALIEVESDNFEDLAETTFDVSKIANNGDTVVILHFNESTSEWEYIGEETVVNGKVSGDFTSYSPVAFVVKKNDGTYETIEQGLNLYKMMKENASTNTINFSVNSMTSGTNGIYTTTATEGNVPVYYYRGAADQVNNNIIFNNMCWKIIRTTETGGVKLIYNGTPTDGKCEATGESTQIGTSAFNASYNDNAYVGYMYGSVRASTYAKTHANTNESTIKSQSIDPWFQANFDETATAKLEDTVFCNDRSTVAGGNNNILGSSYGKLGYGSNVTGYGALARASYYTQVPNPSLVCPNANDKFTVSESNGNGALTYPVGLITLDEVVLAGYNTYSSNNNDYKNTTNYLNTGSNYWTFSSNMCFEGNAYVGFVHSAGYVIGGHVVVAYGVRPVVSLADGTLVTTDGDGTSTKPYVVK